MADHTATQAVKSPNAMPVMFSCVIAAPAPEGLKYTIYFTDKNQICSDTPLILANP